MAASVRLKHPALKGSSKNHINFNLISFSMVALIKQRYVMHILSNLAIYLQLSLVGLETKIVQWTFLFLTLLLAQYHQN